MAEVSWIYHYFIAAPAAKIYAHLSDPNSYIGLSPLVIAVNDIKNGVDSAGRTICTYTSVERFRFLGFLTYDNPIKVFTTFTQPNHQLISDVDSRPGVQVRFVFDFESEGLGAQVSETITARMPGVVRGFVVSQAKSVQQARAQILKKRLEGTASDT